MDESGRYEHARRGVGAGPRPFFRYATERPRASSHPWPFRRARQPLRVSRPALRPPPEMDKAIRAYGFAASRVMQTTAAAGSRAPATHIARQRRWLDLKVSPSPEPPTSARKENLRFPTSRKRNPSPSAHPSFHASIHPASRDGNRDRVALGARESLRTSAVPAMFSPWIPKMKSGATTSNSTG